jgi:hypothetical protein
MTNSYHSSGNGEFWVLQKLKAGYDNAEKFIEISAAKNCAIKALGDGLTNVEEILLLLSDTKSGSGLSIALVKLNTVKKVVLQMMNQPPVELDIKKTDKIHAEIGSGNWSKITLNPMMRLKQ